MFEGGEFFWWGNAAVADGQQLVAMLVELRTTVENVKKEGSLTADILTRIDSAATKLSQAQLQTEEYLGGISEVLSQTHQEFSENMRKTLGEANTQFYDSNEG